MAFKITFYDDREETVEADSYRDQGEWIEFRKAMAMGQVAQVLRVRGSEVIRIDQV